MTAFKKFDRDDIITYSLHSSPLVIMASGSNGWRGNVGTSSSVSLYGGFRSRTVGGISVRSITRLQSPNIDGAVEVSASYPITASLHLVKARNAVPTAVTSVDWGEEHFVPIRNLFEYYSRYNPDYTTASYDYYCLYSERNSKNYVVWESRAVSWVAVHGSASYNTMTSSYTVEAVIKPLTIAGGGQDRFVIVNRHECWALYITGSNGKLVFSASDGSPVPYTSSIPVAKDRWQHVSFAAGNGSGSFTIDMVDAGTVSVTGTLNTSTGSDTDDGVVAFRDGKGVDDTPGTPYYTFHGMLQDLRLWNTKRTYLQISASHDRTLFASASINLILYSRFNDGPMGGAWYERGSGTFDYSSVANHGYIANFGGAAGRNGPVWLPSDNKDFTVPKALVTSSISVMRLFHVPSAFYGRQIATGSVEIVCNAYVSSSLVRTIVDDGRGGLYVSGSYASSSLAPPDLAPVDGNVGNIELNGSSQYLEITDAAQTGLDMLNIVSFNGTTQYASHADAAAFDISSTLSIELLGVVWTALPGGGAFQTLVGKGRVAPDMSYWVQVRDGAPDQLFFFVSADGVAESYLGIEYALVNGQRYDIQCRFDPSIPGGMNAKMTILVNGVVQTPWASSAGVASIFAGAESFRIGNNSVGTEYFDGSIDEVRLWNTARSNAEFAANIACDSLTGSETGLVGCWEFHGDLLDKTANNLDLTANGGPLTYACGAITLGAWINVSLLPHAGQTLMGLLTKDSTAAGGRSYAFNLYYDSGAVLLNAYVDASGDATAGQYRDMYQTVLLSLATWYHVVMRFDPSAADPDKLRIFLDGVVQAAESTSGATSIFNGDALFRVGARQSLATAFNGLIDESFVYRGALSDAAIAALAAGTRPTGLMNYAAYWTLDGHAADETSNNNTLTLVGNPLFSGIEKESYTGVQWNKVGNVFYTEGLIVIKDPALIDIGEFVGAAGPGGPAAHVMPNDIIQLRFRGQTIIPASVFMCRMGPGEFNASNNPTFSRYNSVIDKKELVLGEPVTYPTTVVMYDEKMRAVAVAKMSQPIRKREKDKINVRIKLDF